MSERWYAQPNDLIGGWCVMTEDKPPSEADYGSEVGTFLDQETAEHIARLHNAHQVRMEYEKSKRYRIPKDDWHTIIDTETGSPVVKVFPHGAGSFMGRDDMASGIAIDIEKMLNEKYPPDTTTVSEKLAEAKAIVERLKRRERGEQDADEG